MTCLKRCSRKLLRVLEEKEFERVGRDFAHQGRLPDRCGDQSESGRNAGRAHSQKGSVLSSERYSVCTFLHCRERREDIIPLARHLIDRISEDLQAPRMQVDSRVGKGVLSEHNWPGNVRELSNVMERILSTLDGQREEVNVSDLPLSLKRSRGCGFRIR